MNLTHTLDFIYMNASQDSITFHSLTSTERPVVGVESRIAWAGGEISLGCVRPKLLRAQQATPVGGDATKGEAKKV